MIVKENTLFLFGSVSPFNFNGLKTIRRHVYPSRRKNKLRIYTAKRKHINSSTIYLEIDRERKSNYIYTT